MDMPFSHHQIQGISLISRANPTSPHPHPPSFYSYYGTLKIDPDKDGRNKLMVQVIASLHLYHTLPVQEMGLLCRRNLFTEL